MVHGDRGQVAPLLAITMLGIGLGAFGLARYGGMEVDAGRARTAADAAALAGAAGGEEAAVEAATANGAEVVSWEVAGTDVRVRVRLAGSVVSARARRNGEPWRAQADISASARQSSGAGDRSDRGGLDPAMLAALDRADLALGTPVPVTSGYRSPAEQARLYAGRATNPFPVAPPGASMHQRGLAVDVPRAVADRLADHVAATGLCRPYPVADPVHFELCARRFTEGGGG